MINKKISRNSLKIKPINYGIACRIGDNIYYNKKLEKYPELLKAILQHENRHTSGFTPGDIGMDLRNEEIVPFKKQYYKFILQNPSSITELLPCWKYDGKLVWNPLISVMWGILLGGIWLIAFLLK